MTTWDGYSVVYPSSLRTELNLCILLLEEARGDVQDIASGDLEDNDELEEVIEWQMVGQCCDQRT
jgi:hypothetical protein